MGGDEYVLWVQISMDCGCALVQIVDADEYGLWVGMSMDCGCG